MQFKYSWKNRGACLALSYGIFYLLRGYISETLFQLLFNNTVWNLTNNLITDTILFFVIILIPISMVHESIHAIMYKLFGGKVKYSLRGIYIHAYEGSKLQLNRTKYLIILMVPAMIISAVSLFIPGWIGRLIFILNLFKSTGDLVKAAYLCKTTSTAKIVDRKDGFETSKAQEAVQMTFENI